MPEFMVKKVAKFLFIALMPVLFILGYFSLDDSIRSPDKTSSFSMNDSSFIALIDSQMVLVQGGKFNMGSNGLTAMERPAHEVEVTSFMISKTMVTVEQFSFFVKATGYLTTAEKDSGSFMFDGTSWAIHKNVNWRCDESGHPQSTINKMPVLHVSWYDAEQFCKWLSNISGKSYRLPTEAEWEFSAKGGVKSAGYIFSGGNDANAVSWNGTNSGLKVHPVGQRTPNELGLFDMSGNAWQWCNDWYAENYYTQSPVKDPAGPANGTGKICRGGSYLSGSGLNGDAGTQNQLNPATRGNELPYLSAGDGSFRIASNLLH